MVETTDTSLPGDIKSFFLGNAAPLDPTSYQSLLMRQKLALALAARGSRGYPKNIGEGLTALGEGLGDYRAQQAAQNQLAAYEKYQRANPGPNPASMGIKPSPAAPVAAPAPAVAPRAAVSPFDAGSPPLTVGGSGENDNPLMAYADPTVSPRDRITAALGVPQSNPTDTEAGAPPVTSQDSASSDGVRPEMQPYLNALAGGETAGSRDPYSALGTVTRNGDRAYGKYQIMGANIPQWTQAALGKAMTPQEFLGDQNAQDLTAQHRFGSYLDKYGPQGAARAWYAGEGGMNNLNATDINQKINVGQYGQQFLNRLGGQQSSDVGPSAPIRVASLDPTMAFTAGAPVEARANPPILTDITSAPAQVAQAGGAPIGMGAAGPAPSVPQINRITPPVTMPGTDRPKYPDPAPYNAAEIEGYRRLNLGQRLQDPVMTEQGKTLLEAGKAARDKVDADAKEQWMQDMAIFHARVLAQEGREVGARGTQQTLIPRPGEVAAFPGIPTGAGTTAASSGPPTPGGVVNPGADPNLNTPQSRQRTGLPDMSVVPPGMTQNQWAEQRGPIANKAVEAVQSAVPQFNEALKVLQLARSHPGGQRYGIGAASGIATSIPGTHEYGFAQVMKQLQGENFMSGYQSLRGGGQISNVEGEKTQAARARLATAQNRDDFDKALNDLEISLRTDLETAQRKVNMPVTAWQRSPNDNYAPDLHTVDARPGMPGVYEYLGGNPVKDSSYRRVR